MRPNESLKCDILLIGAGIMSTTLAALLKQVQPELDIVIVERLGFEAKESSGAFNNAGTGHSGFCELNYDLKKAIKTCEAFEESKEFWAHLVRTGCIEPNFINTVPHVSFVQGKENVEFLRKRHEEFTAVSLFEDMEFSDDPEVIKKWTPLLMNGRDLSIPVAATRMKHGTDVDFGALTKSLTKYLTKVGVRFEFYQDVTDITKNLVNWTVNLKDRFRAGNESQIRADFVFIGAGGAALTLLEKTGIPESKGYGGFPVSGQWLICEEPEIVHQHNGKVYGKPETGAPPMSVPHLDTRFIDGKKYLLFGPYAGFTTKFLKYGSWLDFFKSIRAGNIISILESGLRNLSLVKYLFTEVTKTKKSKFKTLQSYYPEAKMEHWKVAKAGQRVQVIKRENGKAIIEFGTEIVHSNDGTISALLGASPGASTSVHIMIKLIEECFKKHKHHDHWKKRLRTIVSSHAYPVSENKDVLDTVEESANKVLGLGKYITMEKVIMRTSGKEMFPESNRRAKEFLKNLKQ